MKIRKVTAGLYRIYKDDGLDEYWGQLYKEDKPSPITGLSGVQGYTYNWWFDCEVDEKGYLFDSFKDAKQRIPRIIDTITG